jgi:hypothetical protein
MAKKNKTREQLKSIIDFVYKWSHNQGYRGYNKHDGLNSPLLRSLLGWGKWPRIIAIQTVMRFPLNIRPVIGIKKTYNPKGLALFCQGFLDLYHCTNDHSYLVVAESLLDTLLDIKSNGNWSGRRGYRNKGELYPRG